MDLVGAVVLVTGGANGLGRLVAAEFGRRGARPVLIDQDRAAGAAAVGELGSAGVDASFLDCDLTDLDAVAGLLDRVEPLGRPVAVVNNAGGWGAVSYPEADPALWRRTLDLNLTTPMLLTQLAAQRLPGAVVVNVSSSAAFGPDDYSSPEYAVAKAGLVRLTGAVGGFADRFGVRVNCVVPHWVGLDRARREYAEMTSEQRTASGGLVDPELVARTVVDLVVDEDANGQVLVLRPDRPPYPVAAADADPDQRTRVRPS